MSVNIPTPSHELPDRGDTDEPATEHSDEADESPQVAREDAFSALVRLVESWRALGRKTYASGVKPGLQLALAGFSENALGYPSFHAFVVDAERLGLIRIQRLQNGQSVVLLPGEPDIIEGHSVAEPTNSSGNHPKQLRNGAAKEPELQGRLKTEVWSTFVEWHENHGRLWDRQNFRAFTYPQTPDGAPAWLSEADRFIAVTPVAQATQIAWMQEWSQQQPEPSRTQLRNALAPGATKGQFRRELAQLELADNWRAELHRRVFAHIEKWASEHSVNMEKLLYQRTPRDAGRPQPTPASHTLPASSSPNAGITEEQRAQLGEMERLRVLVHQAVDRMSLVELLSLPLRAEHLLGD